MEARSTNYRRTIATVQGVLTGLWPDTSSAVPVRVAEDVDELLFGRTDSCERLRDLMKQQAKALKGVAVARVMVWHDPATISCKRSHDFRHHLNSNKDTKGASLQVRDCADRSQLCGANKPFGMWLL